MKFKCSGECKRIKPASAFGKDRSRRDGRNRLCKKCNSARTNEYNKTETGRAHNLKGTHKYRLEHRDDPAFKKKKLGYSRKHSYGISQSEYDKLFARQKGRCRICKEVPKRSLHVDHDHRTGRVRGLLCNSCNTGLGAFKDNPKNLRTAARYVS